MLGPKKILSAVTSASKAIAPVSCACACAGIVIAVVRFTGLGLKFSSAVLGLAQGSLPVALVLTMLASLILGMGLPTTASYIIQAALNAPALIQLGLSLVQAHLFIFYFASIAAITPPVALAAYTAAPICEGNPMIVGFKAFKLGMAAFIVPYMFVYGPGILMIGSFQEVLLAFCSSVIGVAALAAALTGWLGISLHIISCMALLAAAFLLMVQGVVTDLIGLGLAIIVIIIQRLKFRGRFAKT
jgi:TRAP-type uncharacterized transport system fused permease subunit